MIFKEKKIYNNLTRKVQIWMCPVNFGDRNKFYSNQIMFTFFIFELSLIHFLMVLDKRISLLFFFLLNLELYICISSNGRTIECRMKSIGGGILRYDGLMSLFRCLLRIWFASPIVSFCNICMLNNC